jgi:uncharacterized membrane protein YeaQ/YmgE (transglycosylase-associated protein family)
VLRPALCSFNPTCNRSGDALPTQLSVVGWSHCTSQIPNGCFVGPHGGLLFTHLSTDSISSFRAAKGRHRMEQTFGAALGGVMGILLVSLTGLVIGVIAKLLMPGKDPGGWFVTILLGIAGSWVGGFLLSVTGLTGAVPGLIAAVIGAVVLLALYRLIKK